MEIKKKLCESAAMDFATELFPNVGLHDISVVLVKETTRRFYFYVTIQTEPFVEKRMTIVVNKITLECKIK